MSATNDPAEHPKVDAFRRLLFHNQPIGEVTSTEETPGGLLIHAEIRDEMWRMVTQLNPYHAMISPPKPLTRRQRIRHALRLYGLRYRIARKIYPEGFLDDDD